MRIPARSVKESGLNLSLSNAISVAFADCLNEAIDRVHHRCANNLHSDQAISLTQLCSFKGQPLIGELHRVVGIIAEHHHCSALSQGLQLCELCAVFVKPGCECEAQLSITHLQPAPDCS